MSSDARLDSDSDPSTQTCIKCCVNKPVKNFISRTKNKRPTKWCSDCRYLGNEGHKRWAANKKLRTLGLQSTASQVNSANANPAMKTKEIQAPVLTKTPHSPWERPEATMQTQIHHQIHPTLGNYPHVIQAPRTYGIKRSPGYSQILTPPRNPHALCPVAWSFGSPASAMTSSPWTASHEFDAEDAFHEAYRTITEASASQFSDRLKTISCGNSDRERSQARSSEGRDCNDSDSDDECTTDSISSHGDRDDGSSLTENSKDGHAVFPKMKEEVLQYENIPMGCLPKEVSGEGVFSSNGLNGNALKEEDRVSPEVVESPTAPYFICFSCRIPRPTRLGDSGICVYCFEFPTRYCITGAHEEDQIGFVDANGKLHEVCNRCRSDLDPA